MNIQEMIRFLILEKGMSQADISKMTGVTQATISRNLHGIFSPNYRNGKAIENLYHKVMDEQQKAIDNGLSN